MTSLNSTLKLIKILGEKYPAVLSGYFLVGYSFIAIVRLFIKAKKGTLFVEDVYDVFSVLPFMWLLAMSVVRIMQERSKLHEMQEELTREQQRRVMTETQLAYLKKCENALQHKINNPLAVISLSLGRLKRAAQLNSDLLEETNDIESASKTIGSVLTDLSKSQAYKNECVTSGMPVVAANGH